MIQVNGIDIVQLSIENEKKIKLLEYEMNIIKKQIIEIKEIFEKIENVVKNNKNVLQ